MPHEPWIYLPSGRQSRPAGNDPVEGINKLPGFDDPDLSVHNHLRHLLQVGYADHQIGELLARLRRTGLLRARRSIIVTADHGYSFQVGVRSRRLLSERNVEEIAPVPFFVKAPGQTEGRVDQGLVRNIDVVADDRRPARHARCSGSRTATRRSRAATRARREFAIHTRDFAQVVRIGLPEMERRRARWRRRWARLFGTGIESRRPVRRPVGDGLPDRAAPRAARQARVRASRPARAPIRAAVANAALLPRRERRAAKSFPTRVTGPLRGRAVRRAPRRGGGRERADPRRGPQLRPLAEGPRVLLAGGARERAARRRNQRRGVRGAAVRRARAASAPGSAPEFGSALRIHVDVRRVACSCR